MKIMLRSRMAYTALLFLVCSWVFCSTVTAQDDKFSYKFALGGMACTNYATGVQCTNPPPYAMNTAGSSDSHRNIISFDSDGNYALGFEKATRGSWYLSIYTYNPSDKSAGPSIWRASSVDGPSIQVPVNSSLIFSRNGNLELRDSKGSLRWTPATEGLEVTEFEFNVKNKLKSLSGNMILYNGKRQVVWQSKTAEGGNKFSLVTLRRPDMVCTNLPKGIQCTPHLEYPMHTATGSDSHRNIISLDSNGLYALGFERTRGGFYLSIYKFYPSTNSAGTRPTWRARSQDGTDVKVDEKATISFRQNGSIELKNSKGKLVWTTGTKGAGVTEVEFNLDIGNLILYNDQKATVWQSANH